MEYTTNFEDLLIEKYGVKGTEKRDKFDADSLNFRIRVIFKENKLTQEIAVNKNNLQN